MRFDDFWTTPSARKKVLHSVTKMIVKPTRSYYYNILNSQKVMNSLKIYYFGKLKNDCKTSNAVGTFTIVDKINNKFVNIIICWNSNLF